MTAATPHGKVQPPSRERRGTIEGGIAPMSDTAATAVATAPDAGASSANARDGGASTAGGDASSWRRLASTLLLVAAGGDLAVQAFARTVIPPLLAFAVVSIAAAIWVRRGSRAGAVAALVVALLTLAAGAPFAGEALAHPESPIDFLHGVTSTVVRLLAGGAAVGALGRWSTSAARRAAAVAAVLGVLAIVVSGASFLRTGSDAQVAGDVEVGARGAQWTSATVTVASGGSVFVDNQDGFRHTFTVEDAGLSVELPAWQSARIPVDLEPGTYRLVCAVPGHETMTAELVVS